MTKRQNGKTAQRKNSLMEDVTNPGIGSKIIPRNVIFSSE
jgi:hypothetical protein